MCVTLPSFTAQTSFGAASHAKKVPSSLFSLLFYCGFNNYVSVIQMRLVFFAMNAFKIRRESMKAMKCTSITVKLVGAVTVGTKEHGMLKVFVINMARIYAILWRAFLLTSRRLGAV
jgi:hypothetical protein